MPNYGIAHIFGNSRTYLNLIAVCAEYFHSYVAAHKKTKEIDLSKIKQLYKRSADSRQNLSTVEIECGISKSVEKPGTAKLKDFEQLNYAPVAVKDKFDEVRPKFDEQTDHFLYDEVMTHVTYYCRFIEKQKQEKACYSYYHRISHNFRLERAKT